MSPSKDVLGGGTRQTNLYHLSASDHHMSKTPRTIYAYEDDNEYDQEQEVSAAYPKETSQELV